MRKKTYLFARLAWLTALVNFAANWLLIPGYGAVGAAWATFISYVVLTGSYLHYTQRLHPIMVHWSRLVALASLGILVALVSVKTISLQLDWQVIGWKLALALFCLIVGWNLLPLRSMREVV